MNPALPFTLLYAAAVTAAAVSVFRRRAGASSPRSSRGLSSIQQRKQWVVCRPATNVFCRVEKLTSRLAHNQEVAGLSPAPATTLPLTGLVATPRRARRLAPLPAWSLLVWNPQLLKG